MSPLFNLLNHQDTMKQLCYFLLISLLIIPVPSLSMHSSETSIEETSAIFALFAIQARLGEATQNSAIPSTVLPEAKDTPLAPLVIPVLNAVSTKPAPKQPTVLLPTACLKGSGLSSKTLKNQPKSSKAKRPKKPKEKTPYTAVFSLNDPFWISRPTP